MSRSASIRCPWPCPVWPCSRRRSGRRGSIQVTDDWAEPSILWTALIGEPRTRKSPAFTLATAPLADAQRDQFREHADALRRHKEAVDHGERGGEPPTCRRCLLGDATLDSVAPVLQANPRGVLLASEELDSWFQSFTRFTGGKATDRPRWLTLYGGRMLVVDRKSGGTIAVGRAAASLAGTIQPGVYSAAMSDVNKASGLASRILLAMPPRKPRRWSDATVGADTRDRYRGCVLGLLRLDFGPDEEPVPLPLNPEALSYYRVFYNAFGERIDSTLDGDTRAVLGKLEGAALRLALVHELASATDPAAVTTVGLGAVQAGVMMAEWFAPGSRTGERCARHPGPGEGRP